MKERKAIPGPYSYTQEWYDMRVLDETRNPEVCLGASEAGVICGLSKWTTPLELYMVKRGLKDPKEATEAMDWGRALEPAILRGYANQTGYKIIPVEKMFHLEDKPYITATPDAMAVSPDVQDTPLERFCVEAKSTTFRMFDPEDSRIRDCFGEGPDEVPSDYLMQAQHQMLVMGVERCDMPVLFDGNKLRVYTIYRDDSIIVNLEKALDEFYRRIVEGDPPEPDWKHEKTYDLIKGMYDVTPGSEMTMSPEAVQWYIQLREAKDEIAKAERAKEEAMAHLLAEMGDIQVGTIPGYSVQMVRSEMAPSYWTEKDILNAKEMLGQIKRKGYVQCRERKVK